MRNKLRAYRKWLDEGAEKNQGIRVLRALDHVLFHNVGMKLACLLAAILVWNYVIASDTSITRDKTLYGLTGYLTGQSSLTASDLALLEDPSAALHNVNVTVQAPQADYARVTTDSVRVMLDVSSVRTAGTQEVPLRATTNYGSVVGISPESVTVTFEALDSRSVPVNWQLAGESDDYWYTITRVNPSGITISGAASVVRRISSACVNLDLSEVSASTTIAQPYVLLDAAGEEVSQSMLNRSASSISIGMDVYPKTEIPFSTDIEKVTTGQPAEGYVVDSVTINPTSTVVAADQKVLESLEEMLIEPVSVEGLAQSQAVRSRVSALSDLKYISNEEVYVTINIVEEQISAWVDNVTVKVIGLGDGLTAAATARVKVTGARSVVEQIQESGISVTANAEGLGEGTYQLTASYDAALYPDVKMQSEPIDVTISQEESSR